MNRKVLPLIFVLLFISLSTSILAASPYPAADPYGATIVWHLDDDCVDEIGFIDCTNNNGLFDVSTPFASGKSIDYDDVGNDYLDTNFNDLIITDAWTICQWISADSTPPDNDYFIGMISGNSQFLIPTNIVQNWNFILRGGDAVKDGVLGTAGTTFDNTNWQHFCWVHQQGNGADKMNVYLNGTNQSVIIDGDGGISSDRLPIDLYMMARNNGGANQNQLDGKIDDVLIFNNTALGASDIETIWLGNYSAPAPPVPPIFVNITTPLNQSSFNTERLQLEGFKIWINGTHNNDSLTTCSINTTDFTAGSDNGTSNFTFFNNTGLADGNYSFTVQCNRSESDNGSTSVTFFIDTVDPTITINNDNAFNSFNLSNTNQYLDDFLLNITFFDESSLSAYEINITRNNVIFFNVTNTSMSQNEFTFIQNLNISTWPEGLFDIQVVVADDHTLSRIQDYKIDQFANKITFDTDEQTEVSISSVGAYATNYEKSRDRYSFGFDYLLQDSSRTFIVESDKKIRYLPDSRYKAHFVVWNPSTKTGNWIDFEGIGENYQVNKISDYKYEVIFTDLLISKKLILNSIGGLNVVDQRYRWYRGNFTSIFQEVATSNTLQEYNLNISRETGFVDDINATFEYNFTQHIVTKEVNDDHIFFTAEVTVPEGEGVFNFTWNMTVQQNDSSIYNFTINDTQGVFLSVLNISIFDEENQSLITEDVTLTFTLDETTRFTTNTGNIFIGNLSVGEYFLTGESASYPRRGLFLTVANQSNQLNLYLVVDAVGNDFVDLFTKDTSQNNVEDARWTVQRRFNTTFETVAQFESDFAGQGQLFLDQQNEYNIIITHPDFATSTFSLRPLLTRYTFFLQSAFESQYDNVFEGVTYVLTPKQRILNVSNVAYEIRLDIFSDDSSLQYFGIDIDNHSFTCVPASCFTNVTGSPAGGSASIFILLNETGTFDVHYFFKRSGFNLQYISGIDYSAVILDIIFGEGFAQILENLRGDLKTQVMMSLFAAIFTTVLCAIAASLGVNGIPLVLIATAGNLLFTMTKFIPPFIGITVTILGISIWGVLARDDI